MTLTFNPQSGNPPLTVSLNLNLGSTTSRSVEWNFGDGSTHDIGNKLTVTHIYKKSGNFTGTVSVISSDYTSQFQTFNVNVRTASTAINNQTIVNQQNSTATITPLVTVSTDHRSYKLGDTITITGSISYPTNNRIVSVTVRDSLKNLISEDQLSLSSGGIFIVTLKANEPLWKESGTYTVLAQYENIVTAQTRFNFTGNPSPEPIPVPQPPVTPVQPPPSPVQPSATPVQANVTNHTDIVMSKGAASGEACVTTQNCFSPSVFTANVEQSITWYNNDTVSHIVASGNPFDNETGTIFDSGLIKSGETFSFKFINAGTYSYFCQVHPWMTGMVTVTAATSPPPTTNNTAVPEFGPIASLVLVIAVIFLVALMRYSKFKLTRL